MKTIHDLLLQADGIMREAQDARTYATRAYIQARQLKRDLQEFAAEQTGEVQAEKCLTDERK